jgi:plastocyanin
MVPEPLGPYRRIMRPWLALVAVLLAGCGGADPASTRPAVSDDTRRQLHLVAGHDRPASCERVPAEGVKVVVRETFFEPACLEIPAGAPIRFVNQGKARHNVKVRAAQVSVDLEPGALRSITLSVPGSVEAFCRYHVAAGMTMTITVE